MMPDENEQPDTAPDGADELTQARDRADRMAAQRRELGTKYDQSLEKIRELEAKLAEASKKPEPTGQPAPGNMPEWAKTFMESVAAQVGDLGTKVEGLDSSFKEHRTNDAYSRVEQAVLAKVPEGNKETAKALLKHLDVDYTQPGAAADALAKLQEQHSVVMVDVTRGPRPVAPQKKPDGSLDFSQFNHPSEIPPEFAQAAAADPKTMDRLLLGIGVGSSRESDGANI